MEDAPPSLPPKAQDRPVFSMPHIGNPKTNHPLEQVRVPPGLMPPLEKPKPTFEELWQNRIVEPFDDARNGR